MMLQIADIDIKPAHFSFRNNDYLKTSRQEPGHAVFKHSETHQ